MFLVARCFAISEVDDNLFNKGTGFDGSSVRGFQSIEASDMLLLHAETANVDPFEEKTVSIIAILEIL